MTALQGQTGICYQINYIYSYC